MNRYLLKLAEFVENSVYELVILDVGESIQGLYGILDRCDRIYMPVLEDAGSEIKMKRYDNNLRQLNMETLERRTTRFVMPQKVEDFARIRAKEEMR